jgi:hypothetical protein
MRRLLIAGVLLLAAAAVPVPLVHGQAAQTDQKAPTLDDITVAIGNEVDSRNVFVTVLTHAMRDHKREFFLASQIRNDWMPVLQGVEFVRLADTEIVGHISACGRYWIVSLVERANSVVRMKLNQRCGGTTLDYIVSFDGAVWRIGPPGTG